MVVLSVLVIILTVPFFVLHRGNGTINQPVLFSGLITVFSQCRNQLDTFLASLISVCVRSDCFSLLLGNYNLCRYFFVYNKDVKMCVNAGFVLLKFIQRYILSLAVYKMLAYNI